MQHIQKRTHLFAILFLFVCATGYLFDVLFLNKHLSAFDFLLEKPSWSVEFGKNKAENTMLSDSPTAHYPYKKEFWEGTKHGYNVQYLPHIFSGKPTVGQGTGIFSTSLFQLFMDIPNALDFSTWFRLLLAGIFMYVFLVQLSLPASAAVLGAIAWTYNMHQIAWLLFPQHLATQLWLPLLLSLNLFVLKNRANLAGLLGLIVTVVLFYTSGYTQIVLYTFLFIGAFNTFYVLIVQQSTWADKLKNWLWIHLIYLCAGALLLPDALWQAQEIAEGLRGTQDFRYNRYALDISAASLIQLAKDIFPNSLDVIRFLMPNYLGELGRIPPIKEILRSNVVEFQVYFGLICLYLSVYGLIRGFIAKDRLVIVMAIMFFLCTALFNRNPLIISLLNMIPFAGSGSYGRIITLVLFMAIILSAYGAKYLLDDLRNKNYLAVIAALGLILLWLGIGEITYGNLLKLKEFIPWMIYLGMFLLVSICLAKFKKHQFIIPLAIVLTFSELVVTGYNFNTRIAEDKHFPENQIIKTIRNTDGDFRTALLMNHTGYHHNILSYYDLSTLGGYETTAPSDYLYFMREAYRKIHVTLNGILFLFEGQLQILPLLNTRYVVSNLGLQSDHLEPIYENKTEVLYKVKNHQQRAYCASDQIANATILEIPHQFAKLAKMLERPVVLAQPVLADEKLTENCEVSNLKVYSSKLEFDVNTDEATLVFIPTNYHQYWTASVNDTEAEIIKANYTFMAVKVDPGTSHIKLEFINQKLTLAAILLITLGFVCIWVGLSRFSNGWQKPVFLLFGILLIGKNLMSIPGVMNTDVPEKPPVVQIQD